jgi:hypothetical protein
MSRFGLMGVNQLLMQLRDLLRPPQDGPANKQRQAPMAVCRPSLDFDPAARAERLLKLADPLRRMPARDTAAARCSLRYRHLERPALSDAAEPYDGNDLCSCA